MCARGASAIAARRSGDARRSRISVLHLALRDADPASISAPSSSLTRASSSGGGTMSWTRPDPVRLRGREALRRQEIAPRVARADRLDDVRARSSPGSGRASPRTARTSRRCAAIAMSQQATRPTPPPNDAPCTRATVGFAEARERREQLAPAPARRRGSARRRTSPSGFIQLRSAPAQKLRPAPSSTIGAHVGVGVERDERIGQLRDHRLVERVVHVRPVQHDERDGPRSSTAMPVYGASGAARRLRAARRGAAVVRASSRLRGLRRAACGFAVVARLSAAGAGVRRAGMVTS